MRIIIFDGQNNEDPVHMGEILEIITDNEKHVVKVIPEKGTGSCAGCVFFGRDCRVPNETSSCIPICAYTNCVFKPISDIVEEI